MSVGHGQSLAGEDFNNIRLDGSGENNTRIPAEFQNGIPKFVPTNVLTKYAVTTFVTSGNFIFGHLAGLEIAGIQGSDNPAIPDSHSLIHISRKEQEHFLVKATSR